MSKKTRKKSSNTTGKRAATKVARAASTSPGKSVTKAHTSAAKPKAKSDAKSDTKNSSKTSGKTTAKTTAKTGSKPGAKTTPTVQAKASQTQTSQAKDSHKAASKPLKAKPAASGAESSPAKSAGVVLAEGANAPAFNLPRDGGGNVSLADFAGRKLVLFFYPRANTPGCTKEAIDFTRLKSEFAAAGTEVLGISGDTVKAQESFRNKHQLSVPLISDEQHEMLEAYGVWGEKSLYGRTFMGIVRTTVLLDSSAKVARIWRHVKVDGHADAVLAAARSL